MHDSGTLCYAIKSKISEEVTLDFIPIIKGFLTACTESMVETRSIFSTYGENVYVIFRIRPKDTQRCRGVAEALLSALLPETVTYECVKCEKLPFHGNPYGHASRSLEGKTIQY